MVRPMTGQLRQMALYEPLNTLKPLSENLWIVDGPVVKMSLLGVKFPFPTRMTVIRLKTGQLWCHSPTVLTPGLEAELGKLGPVTYLIAPNKLHYVHLPNWRQKYPNSLTWAADGVTERAAQHGISIQVDAQLRESEPAPWADEIEACHFRGQFMEEVIFFHRPSRTLIVTDLIENFEPNRVPLWLRIPLRLAGNLAPHGKAPLDLRLTFLRNKSQLRQQRHQLLDWHPQRIVLAHGALIENNAVENLERAFRWLG